MMLADLESIQKRLDKKNKKNLDDDEQKLLETVLEYINNNKNLNDLHNQFDKKKLNTSGLLCTKPKIFVCNIDEKSIKGEKAFS